MKRTLAMTASAAIAMAGSLLVAAPATAAPNANNQSGGAAGLVAAVVQANIQDVDVTVIDGDVNVTLTNLLNNNRILTDLLNDNNVTVTDVVDVAIVDNVLVILVDVL